MKLLYTIPVEPVAKPRMTRSDSWKKRECVVKYWEFKDSIQKHLTDLTLPVPGIARFFVPMPKSWSKKKKAAMLHQPKLTVPDVDNYVKALLDAVYDNDSEVWDFRGVKVWSDTGYIEIWENDMIEFTPPYCKYSIVKTSGFLTPYEKAVEMGCRQDLLEKVYRDLEVLVAEKYTGIRLVQNRQDAGFVMLWTALYQNDDDFHAVMDKITNYGDLRQLAGE